MKCDIYKSTTRPGWYVIVPAGVSLSTLPDSVSEFIGQSVRFKTRDFEVGDKLVGADSAEVLRNISQNGFHVQSVQIQSNVSVAGTALGGGVLGATFGGGVGALIGSVVGYAVAQNAKEKEEKNVF